jgi:hypothetical protein
MKLKLWFIGTLAASNWLAASAALTTNSWNDGSSKWELGSNWDHGVPSLTHSLTLVTGGIPIGGKVITIDVVTVSSNLINNCLTVSNLTVGGNAQSPHTLFLNNSSDSPGTIGLTVNNTLTISSFGALSITNSYLYTSQRPSGPGVFNDGFVLLNTGTLITSPGTLTIGHNGAGRMTVQDGLWTAAGIAVGNSPGSQGTLTISGGSVNSVGNGVNVGWQDGSTGTLWLTGGD